MDDKKILEIACKEVLMNIVKESETLNKKLTFFEKTLLYDKISQMNYKDVLRLLYTEQKRDQESILSKNVKYAAAGYAGSKVGKTVWGGAPIKIGKETIVKAKSSYAKAPTFFLHKMVKGGIRGAALATAALFAYRKFSDPCVKNNLGNKQAQIECKMTATKKVIALIHSDMKKCKGAPNPTECSAKLQKVLDRYTDQYNSLLKQANRYR